MTRGLNRLSLIGNVGADPEVRNTASGMPVANCSLAVNGSRRRADGAYEDTTEWFRLIFFDRNAETAHAYVTKGQRLYVEGRLQTRPYEDKKGVLRTAIEVIVNVFIMLDERESLPEEDGDDRAVRAESAGRRGGPEGP